MYKKIILLMLIVVINASGNDYEYYFYNPDLDYGSESIFNPISLFINGSFDILRNGAHNKNIFDQPYKTGFNNVIDNVLHPIDNIRNYGVKNFLNREIFNLEVNKNESQFLPNIGLHLIGNGMQYRKLAEWYDYHEYPTPNLLSIITTISYQLVNEIVENGSYSGTNVDPISDMLIFNPLGILLFSTKAGQEFFSTKMPIYDWSMNPYFNPNNYYLENAGQQYATKIKLKTTDKNALFGYWGVVSTFGISHTINETDAISFSAGAVVAKLTPNEEYDSRFIIPNLDYAVAIFYDRNNSLLGSLTLFGPKFYNLRLEIFPGLIGFKNYKPGYFIGIGEMDNFQIGITFPPIPIGIIGKVTN